jgi:hypothetical protein
MCDIDIKECNIDSSGMMEIFSNGPTRCVALRDIVEKYFHELSEAERVEITSIFTDWLSIIRADGQNWCMFFWQREGI